MKRHLKDLAVTYQGSTLPQLKVLLGSIFTSSPAWDNSGVLNYKISPLYQAIREADALNFAFGDPDGIQTRDFQDENLVS